MIGTSPAQQSASAAPALSLAEYLALVAALPVPSSEQMAAFATFVCGAHSWYKHLPFYPPGRPFQFFLDPAAGMDLSFHADRVEATPRLEHGVHYSSIPTAKYRELFGHLAFSQGSGTKVYRVAVDGSALATSDDVPAVYDPIARSLRHLPAEVVAEGVAMVSGIVHPAADNPNLVLMFATERARAAWPEESGGQPALVELLAYCKVLREQFRKARQHGSHSDDDRLRQLLEPERARQRNGMVAAMTRVAAMT